MIIRIERMNGAFYVNDQPINSSVIETAYYVRQTFGLDHAAICTVCAVTQYTGQAIEWEIMLDANAEA